MNDCRRGVRSLRDRTRLTYLPVFCFDCWISLGLWLLCSVKALGSVGSDVGGVDG